MIFLLVCILPTVLLESVGYIAVVCQCTTSLASLYCCIRYSGFFVVFSSIHIFLTLSLAAMFLSAVFENQQVSVF